MSNIIAVYEREMPTVSSLQMGMGNLFYGLDINFTMLKNTNTSADDIQKADCIILIRPHDYLSMKIAQKCRVLGAFVIVFLDDDMLMLPASEPSIPWRIKALKKTLGYSDLVLSSNQFITEKYRTFTCANRFALMNTAISDEEYKGIPNYKKKDVVKLVYAAGRNHEELFNRYILPILPKLNDSFGKKISLDFVGTHPILNSYEFEFNIQYHDSMPLMEYRKFMIEQNYDIGLSPLGNDQFSACKYYNKYIEYTLVGATGVYSNVEPYTFIIRDGYNGSLADNLHESWLKKISLLITNESLRQECVNHAVAQLKAEFSVNRIREKLIGDIPELIMEKDEQGGRASIIAARIVYKLYRLLDTVYLFFFYLKSGGPKKVLAKVIYHIKN